MCYHPRPGPKIQPFVSKKNGHLVSGIRTCIFELVFCQLFFKFHFVKLAGSDLGVLTWYVLKWLIFDVDVDSPFILETECTYEPRESGLYKELLFCTAIKLCGILWRWIIRAYPVFPRRIHYFSFQVEVTSFWRHVSNAFWPSSLMAVHFP